MDATQGPVNFLELRVCGLQHSGNHAIIDWIMVQHEGAPICFLNNVRHGDSDPFTSATQSQSMNLGPRSDVENIRRKQKKLLIYSYEDDLGKMDECDSFLDSVFDADFEKNRSVVLGDSQHRIDLLIIRDPFNFLASRVKSLDSLSGIKDMDAIVENWKSLALETINFEGNPEAGRMAINYNSWFVDESYRRKLSARLHGKYSDKSLATVSGLGGGSSFNSTEYSPLTFDVIRKKWRKLFDPRTYLRVDHYLKRLRATGAQNMNVLERWREMEDNSLFQSVFSDQSVLELSEEVFGEFPGTRLFVDNCRRMLSECGR